MFSTEACCKCIFAYADTDQVTLTGMHDTFQTVDEVVEFTFKYGFEVCLHVLAGYFYYTCQRLHGAFGHLIDFRSDYFDLVVFYFC